MISVERVGDHNADDVFYAYRDFDFSGAPLPHTAEEAYEMGLLIIEATSPGNYYLRIGNQEYESNSIFTLEQILFKWATEEGYRW